MQAHGKQGAGTKQAESKDKASREQAHGRQSVGTRQAERRHKAGIMKAHGRQGESSPKGKHAEKIKKRTILQKTTFLKHQLLPCKTSTFML